MDNRQVKKINRLIGYKDRELTTLPPANTTQLQTHGIPNNYTFDTLPAMEISNINTTLNTTSDKEKDFDENLVTLPLSDEMLSKFQEQDSFCSHIIAQIKRGNIKEGQT